MAATGSVGPRDDSDLKGLDLIITVCGKSGAGKTTLINKLFGEDLIIPLTPDKGTPDIQELKPKGSASVSIRAIDVPGFEPSNQKGWKEILTNLTKFGEGKVSFILLCIPVGPGHKFDSGNPEIMEYMHEILGKEVWQNCIVIFTMSNLARDRQKSDADYEAYIEDYTTRFQEELSKYTKEIEVKSIFQYKPGSVGKTTIVTIPAGDEDNDRVNPHSQQPWIDDIYDLMKEKCPSKKFGLADYREWWSRRKQGVLGAVGGAAAGGMTGWKYGGLAGGLAGGLVGGLAGVGIGVVYGIVGAFTGFKRSSKGNKEEKSTKKTN